MGQQGLQLAHPGSVLLWHQADGDRPRAPPFESSPPAAPQTDPAGRARQRVDVSLETWHSQLLSARLHCRAAGIPGRQMTTDSSEEGVWGVCSQKALLVAEKPNVPGKCWGDCQAVKDNSFTFSNQDVGPKTCPGQGGSWRKGSGKCFWDKGQGKHSTGPALGPGPLRGGCRSSAQPWGWERGVGQGRPHPGERSDAALQAECELSASRCTPRAAPSDPGLWDKGRVLLEGGVAPHTWAHSYTRVFKSKNAAINKK